MTATIRINAATPFLQGVPNSLVSKDWYRALRNFAILLGDGQEITTLDDFEEEVETTRAPVDYAPAIQALSDATTLLSNARDMNHQLSTRIAELEAIIAGQSRTASGALISNVSIASEIADNTTLNAAVYPSWVLNYSGNQLIQTSHTKFTFNPSTGLLTTTLMAAASFNKVAVTPPATGSTLTLIDGKTFTVDNTLTISGTDGSTLNIGTGGTLGTAAYTASSSYVPANAAVPSGGAATAAGVAYSQSQVQSIVTLANNIRTALIANNIMS